MKKLIWIVLAIILAAAVYMWVKPSSTEPVENQPAAGESVSAEGVVSSVNLEEITFDGPALVTIATESGEEVIAIPSMGINLCAAKDNIADVYALEVGQKVSVLGEKDAGGRIVPCVESSHYLRVQ